MLKRGENGYSTDNDVLPFNTSPHFPNRIQHLFDPDDNEEDLPYNTSPHSNTTSDDQGVWSDIPDKHSRTCKLPLAPLFWCSDKRVDDNDHSYYCQACTNPQTGGHGYYICVTCDKMFHKECVEAPLFIKHPSFPFLSLQLYTSPNDSNHLWMCISCENWIYDIVYHCPISNFKMHPFCAMQPIPIFIDRLKRHPHSLTFFPKQNSLLCNVCGVIKDLIPTYVCARCVFVVHQDCIDFPYVIRISRHPHRVSFTYSLPSGELSCGVCRKEIDNNYGAYSCNKCSDYFVHSRCALRRDLWDGEELEGVPEEPEIVVEPFKTIADGIILHFSHDYHLKLGISRVYDDEKFCQACMLPIFEGSYYSCMDHCDFILHEACANSPLKKHHPLNAHSFTLRVATTEYDNRYGTFRCDACRRHSCGFVYENRVNDWSSKLDVKCASVSEPFKYEGHEHPLYLALTPEEEESAICQICQDTGATYYCRRKLNCIECDYVICFECATQPYKARYKYDSHALTFREGKEANDQSCWCEICENEMVYSREKGFYSCDDYCCTTLHVYCLLGTDPYMKPGHTININEEKVRIRRNNTMLRPFCYGSGPQGKCDVGRCPYKIVFEKRGKTFCSYYCAITRIE